MPKTALSKKIINYIVCYAISFAAFDVLLFKLTPSSWPNEKHMIYLLLYFAFMMFALVPQATNRVKMIFVIGIVASVLGSIAGDIISLMITSPTARDAMYNSPIGIIQKSMRANFHHYIFITTGMATTLLYCLLIILRKESSPSKSKSN